MKELEEEVEESQRVGERNKKMSAEIARLESVNESMKGEYTQLEMEKEALEEKLEN